MYIYEYKYIIVTAPLKTRRCMHKPLMTPWKAMHASESAPMLDVHNTQEGTATRRKDHTHRSQRAEIYRERSLQMVRSSSRKLEQEAHYAQRQEELMDSLFKLAASQDRGDPVDYAQSVLAALQSATEVVEAQADLHPTIVAGKNDPWCRYHERPPSWRQPPSKSSYSREKLRSQEEPTLPPRQKREHAPKRMTPIYQAWRGPAPSVPGGSRDELHYAQRYVSAEERRRQHAREAARAWRASQLEVGRAALEALQRQQKEQEASRARRAAVRQHRPPPTFQAAKERKAPQARDAKAASEQEMVAAAERAAAPSPRVSVLGPGPVVLDDMALKARSAEAVRAAERARQEEESRKVKEAEKEARAAAQAKAAADEAEFQAARERMRKARQAREAKAAAAAEASAAVERAAAPPAAPPVSAPVPMAESTASGAAEPEAARLAEDVQAAEQTRTVEVAHQAAERVRLLEEARKVRKEARAAAQAKAAAEEAEFQAARERMRKARLERQAKAAQQEADAAHDRAPL